MEPRGGDIATPRGGRKISRPVFAAFRGFISVNSPGFPPGPGSAPDPLRAAASKMAAAAPLRRRRPAPARPRRPSLADLHARQRTTRDDWLKHKKGGTKRAAVNQSQPRAPVGGAVFIPEKKAWLNSKPRPQGGDKPKSLVLIGQNRRHSKPWREWGDAFP